MNRWVLTPNLVQLKREFRGNSIVRSGAEGPKGPGTLTMDHSIDWSRLEPERTNDAMMPAVECRAE